MPVPGFAVNDCIGIHSPWPVVGLFDLTGRHVEAGRPPEHRRNERHSARQEGDRAEANVILCRRQNPLGNRPRREPDRATPVASIPMPAKHFTTSMETMGHDGPRLRHEGEKVVLQIGKLPQEANPTRPSRPLFGNCRDCLDKRKRILRLPLDAHLGTAPSDRWHDRHQHRRLERKELLRAGMKMGEQRGHPTVPRN